MIENSSNPKLKAAFEHHMAETQNQVRRVEQVFEMCNSKPKSVDCPAIDGIIKEAKEVAGDVPVEDEAVLDAALIAAAQAVPSRAARAVGPGGRGDGPSRARSVCALGAAGCR